MTEKLPYFTFKGRRSLDFGLVISKKTVYDSAKRDVSVTSVPGRDGDLIIDNGRYTNVKIRYDLQVVNKMTPWSIPELAQILKDWLLPEPGYCELWDTYDPRYYRMAAYVDSVSIEQQLNDLGSLSLTFNCKPFRYSTEGQITITLTAENEIYNGEAYPSKPYIKITGSGNITLTVNGTDYELSSVSSSIELDSEMMNAYRGTTNLNGSFSGTDFPIFKPGVNSISWTGTVSKVEIIPRWCCL